MDYLNKFQNINEKLQMENEYLQKENKFLFHRLKYKSKLIKSLEDKNIFKLNERIKYDVNLWFLKNDTNTTKNDIEEIKKIIKKAYNKIKIYLKEKGLDNNLYTINDIYHEYDTLIAVGIKPKDINKGFYDTIIRRYKAKIDIAHYAQ